MTSSYGVGKGRVEEGGRKTRQLIRSLENCVGILRLGMECLMIYRFQIYEYSQQMDDNVEKEISCDVTLKIIDIILLNETSLNKPTVRRKMPLIMLTD